MKLISMFAMVTTAYAQSCADAGNTADSATCTGAGACDFTAGYTVCEFVADTSQCTGGGTCAVDGTSCTGQGAVGSGNHEIGATCMDTPPTYSWVETAATCPTTCGTAASTPANTQTCTASHLTGSATSTAVTNSFCLTGSSPIGAAPTTTTTCAAVAACAAAAPVDTSGCARTTLAATALGALALAL
jgi:hypothetical protein